jgi:glutaredoxin 3
MKPVKMFSTQQCPFCIRAKLLLKQRGVEHIEEIRIDLEPQQRDVMMQVFIGDTHVGGCDDLMALDARGGLQALLAA